MGKLHHEYEVRDTATNKVVDTIYIPEDTETKRWVLGIWYLNKDKKCPIAQIKSNDNSRIATYKGYTFITPGDDLF